jgi:hypothetical protein
MAKFNELSDADKIQYIKDGFVLIVEQLAKDPEKIKQYVNTDQPKLATPTLETPKEGASEEEKKQLTERNEVLMKSASESNAKLETDFKKRMETFEKIKGLVSNLKKVEGCLCGGCLTIDLTNGTMPPELECIIDAARKEAEEKNY